MTTDYIPTTEAAFDGFLANFLTTLAANIAPLGVTPEQMTVLTTAHTDYLADEAQRNATTTAYNGHVKSIVHRRNALTKQVRDLVQTLQHAPGMTDSLRGQLGITVTKAKRSPINAPTTAPVLTLSMGLTRQHILTFSDSATPKLKAKPAGVQGCQIYELIVAAGSPPPTDPALFGFLALITRVPYAIAREAADIGKTAYYVACWQNNKGEAGPYGEIRGLTIAG